MSDVDPDAPSAARIYDYFLGGSHNFAVDRDAARDIIAAVPDVPLIAQANRAFVRRVTTYLAQQGVRQFLDIGSGIPTAGNVHEIAQRANPSARVVYIDIDPVAVAHSREILTGNDHATAIQADLREPKQILAALDPTGEAAPLDLDQPVALLITSVLHFVPGEQAYTCVNVLRDALAPGSFLAISHSAVEGFANLHQDASDKGLQVYRRTNTPAGLRTTAEITRFFDGWDLIEPGLVWVSQWHADDGTDPRFAQHPEQSGMLAGLSHKPR